MVSFNVFPTLPFSSFLILKSQISFLSLMSWKIFSISFKTSCGVLQILPISINTNLSAGISPPGLPELFPSCQKTCKRSFPVPRDFLKGTSEGCWPFSGNIQTLQFCHSLWQNCLGGITTYWLRKSKKTFALNFTSDLEKHLISHNELGQKAWRINYRPWKVVYSEFFENKKEAMLGKRF